ncbi:MAG: outer membrane beta-barrel protein [Flavobacteriales bacterium]|nr:outer membrane beta-barrel protein [Flavobacteriales bacterium]
MKNLLLIVFTMAVCSGAVAQDQAVGPKMRKKFRIGFNLSPSVDFFQPNTDGVDLDKAKVKFGYGMMAEYAFTNNYAIAFGLEHKMSGAALDFGADADARYIDQSDKNQYRLLTRTYRYDYVNIPITLKLMTNEIGYFTYFGQFGADVSVLASARTKDERQLLESSLTDSVGAVTETFSAASETDFTGRYNQSMFINVKLRIGAGFEWNFSGNTSLVASVSYHNGFIDLMRDPDMDKVNNDEGLFKYDSSSGTRTVVPFAMNANLHHVALNVGILF